MSTPQEKLIDAIGGVSDRNVELAVGEYREADSVYFVSFGSEGQTVRQTKKPLGIKDALIGIAAAAVLCLGGFALYSSLKNMPETAQPSEAAESTGESAANSAEPEISVLGWGMRLDEVKLLLKTEASYEEYSASVAATTLGYENVPFMGYDTTLEIMISDIEGLNDIAYYIPSDDPEELFYKLYSELYDEYGETSGAVIKHTAEWKTDGSGSYIVLKALDEFVLYELWHDSGIKEPEVEFSGDGFLDSSDIKAFEKYFYGGWKLRSEDDETMVLNYSDNRAFPVGFCSVMDIFEGSDINGRNVNAFLRIKLADGSITTLRIAPGEPDVLYEYRDCENGIQSFADYDRCYDRTEAAETDGMSVFGELRYSLGLAEVQGESVDLGIDYESLVLDRAQTLAALVRDYCGNESEIELELGDIYEELYKSSGGRIAYRKVISPHISSLADISNMFDDKIYGAFVYHTVSERLREIEGELYYTGDQEYPDTMETWYLGAEMTDGEITGHFAELKWGRDGVNESDPKNAEFLNDINNYAFYDITIKNTHGVYIVTDCRYTDGSKEQCRLTHGYYNKGIADRSLITDARIMPAEYRKQTKNGEFSPSELKEIQSTVYRFGRLWHDYVCCWGVETDPHDSVKTGVYSEFDAEGTDTIWYRVTSPPLSYDSIINDVLGGYMAGEALDTARERTKTRYMEQDGKLYLSADAGNARLYHYANSVYLSSVQRSVGNSIVAAFHVYNSDSLTDFVDSFIVRLIPSGNGYKVTEYADGGNDYLARFYVISTYDSFR